MTSLVLAALAAATLAGAPDEDTATCLRCHETRSPSASVEWRSSRHARAGIGCVACHGRAHAAADDAAAAVLPGPDECGRCHPVQQQQWRGGKHARAWTAVKKVPGLRHASGPAADDPLACLGCHGVGLTAAVDLLGVRDAGASYGVSACASCHQAHAFSRLAARQPTTCARCHGGPDHPQWESWASSRHGARWVVRGGQVDPGALAPPTCQDCHFREGAHTQRTPWGTLALPLVLPNDPVWAADRLVLLRALGLVDAQGALQPDAYAYLDAAVGARDRLEQQRSSATLADACRGCHDARFVRETNARREAALRECDLFSADAVRQVLRLHEAGALEGDFPDLVEVRGGLLVERRLAEMIFDHRVRFVAATFHGSPAAASWRAVLARDREDVRRLTADYLAPPPKPRRR